MSSGFCIGGTNWLVESPFKRIAYLGPSSSTTMRHPSGIDTEPLIGSDVLIVSDVNVAVREPPVRAMMVCTRESYPREY